MRKIVLLLSLFLAAGSAIAQNLEKVMVKKSHIPVLIEREDNPIFYIRIDAPDYQNLTNISFSFKDESSADNIKSVKLYYSGTESAQRSKELYYQPVEYISRNTPGKTLSANPSYSILVDQIKKPKSSLLSFDCDVKLYTGVNYFWISIEMKPETSLLESFIADIESVKLDGQPQTIHKAAEKEKVHRMAIGVRHAGDDSSASYRIPGMVTTNDGTLLGVYDIRYNSSVDLQEFIDVGLSRSTDKGQTWEKMQKIMEFGEYDGLPKFQNGVGDPAILVDKESGTIWCIAIWLHGVGNNRAWSNSGQGNSINETAQLMLTKSEDDGKTWSEPVNITNQVKDESWFLLLQGPGNGITMSDGTLVFPIQYIDKDRMPHAGVMYSKDKGETWTIHNPAHSNTTEAQVVEVSEGELMLNMRDNRGGSRSIYTTKDLGKTWTAHQSNRSALQESVCMASLIKVEAKDNELGRDILFFSNPNTTSGRHSITIKASLDGGKTWKESNQLLLDEAAGWGYSSLSLVDNESVGILYESSQAHMLFQRIKISDIIKEL
ncbi:MAG: sialidase family protein [Rikenellaceae bacterium]